MIFLDSSFLVAYGVNRDSNHERATKIIGEIVSGKYGKVFSSDYILDEAVTVALVRSKSLANAVSVGETIKESTNMIKLDQSEFEESWNAFKLQSGSRFSFTDCTIISIMKKYGILNLATFDEEFKKIKWANIVG